MTEIFTAEKLNEKIKNPYTNRMVKIGNIVSKTGFIYRKYVNDFELNDQNELVGRPLYAVSLNDDRIIKIMRNKPILTQPFQDIKLSKLKPNTTINNYDILLTIPSDRPVVTTFIVDFMWIPSEGYEPLPKKLKLTTRITPAQLSDEDYLRELINPIFTAEFGVYDIRFETILTENEKTMDLVDMELREETPLKLNYIYNEIIDKDHTHCVHDYIKDCYPKYTKSEKQMAKIRKMNTITDIYEWAVQRDFKMVAFDQSGNIVKAHYPKKMHRAKTMIFIAANNHLYPLKNVYLHKTKPDSTRAKIIDNVEEKLVALIESGSAPKYVLCGMNGLDYFTTIEDKTEIQYVNNPQYTRCLEILNMFGIGDKIKATTRICALGEIIEQLYNKRHSEDGRMRHIDTKSFMPEMRQLSKAGYVYVNEDFEIDTTQECLGTIDKNVSYPYELYKLTHLPVCDIKQTRPIKITDQNHKIKAFNMYIVSVEKSTIILPKNGRFFGSTLIYAQEHYIKFTLHEEIEMTIVPNYMKRMVKDLYDKYYENLITKYEFKEIMNLFIGKFESKTEKFVNTKYVKIMNEDERKTFDGLTRQLTDAYSIGYTTYDNFKIYSRNPIADLIKDNSRITVYEMMDKLGLKNSDIKQLKTDSITFKHKSVSKDFKHYINKEIYGWKTEEYKEMKKPDIYNDKLPSFFYNKSHSGELITGYAGCGKTHDILNNIIPNLYKPYRVLTPSHKALEEYRKNGCVCDVIQKYTMNNRIPEEHNIIVDEIGMVDGDGWDMLYKAKLSGKNIIAYGDFKQLAPVTHHDTQTYDNPNFLDLMFGKHTINNNNYRNTFTHEYYDTLRFNAKHIREAVVAQYNTSWEDADIIIAYLNTTRKKYNTKMCDKLGITSITDIGARVICKTNDFSNYDIYNNFTFRVKSVDEETIELETENGNTYNLPLKKYLNKNKFQYGYALTLYATQGSSLKSFHYCMEDIKLLDGRGLYTLISRLKTI